MTQRLAGKSLKKLLSVTASVIFVTSLLCNEILAYSFLEDFSPIKTNDWVINENGGQVSSVAGDTVLSSTNSQLFPYLYSGSGIVPPGDFELETRFTISGPLNYGSGLGLSEIPMDNQRNVDMAATDILFQSWTLTNPPKFSIWTSLCPENMTSCSESTYREIAPVRYDFGTYHTLKISYSDGYYDVYIDGVFIGKFFSAQNRVIKYYWAGNPEKTNTLTTRASVYLDYLKINSINDRLPVIILPGFGGSCPLLQRLS